MARLLSPPSSSSPNSLIRMVCFLLIFVTLHLLARGLRSPPNCGGAADPDNPPRGPHCSEYFLPIKMSISRDICNCSPKDDNLVPPIKWRKFIKTTLT
ncbi:hypothetical protein BT93_J2046 [Corymbia citriodora subsp. variegata]|nr:hypothetical protein BT93_J2046 [Corymbia citriodora subsp. variegata]